MERIKHVTLSSPEGLHYVAVKHGRWLQIIAAFYDQDRAEQYCGVENDMFADEGELWPDLEAPPAIDPPPSRVRVENFTPPNPAQNITENIPEPATVRKDRTVELVVRQERTTEPQAEETKEEAEAEAPKSNGDGQKLPAQQFRREGEEAPRPKPVTAGWPTARDPNLIREPVSKGPVEMPKGSPAQQLADRIEAELPELMKLHFRGPIIADLVSHYDESEARIGGAVRYLVSKRKVSLITVEGQRAQHVVPPDFDGPSNGQGRPPTVDHDYRRATVLQVLKDASEDGLVEMSMPKIAKRSDVPLGSIAPLMRELTASGALELVRKADVKSKQSAQYRVTA